jgi:hypothetical protein
MMDLVNDEQETEVKLNRSEVAQASQQRLSQRGGLWGDMACGFHPSQLEHITKQRAQSKPRFIVKYKQHQKSVTRKKRKKPVRGTKPGKKAKKKYKQTTIAFSANVSTSSVSNSHSLICL